MTTSRSLVHHGFSMAPTLRPGDVLELRSCTDPRVGDLLAVRVGERVVVHRLVGWVEDRAMLRGDANVSTDPLVPRDAIVGRVTSAMRGGTPISLDYPHVLSRLLTYARATR